MANRKYRILALDGGGIRGVISAKILERVETKIKQITGNENTKLNEYFDLIAGTSTGSILAASLVYGRNPTDLIGIYKDEGETIFKTNFLRKTVGYALKMPKFSNDGLKGVLQEYFKDKNGQEISLKDLREVSKQEFPGSNPKARLLILAYSTTQRYTNFFLSPLVDEDPWYKEAKVWEVCLSSAAAPTFFPPYKFDLQPDEKPVETDSVVPAEYTFVDGGVAANNPALGALVHALSIEKLEGKKLNIEDISLLSIGTGRTTAPLEFQQVNGWGALNWALHIPDVFMGGQFQITADLCAQLIRSVNPNGYLRLQFELNRRYEQQNGKTVRLKKPVNLYTEQPLDEAMDKGDRDHVETLENTTEAFLDSEIPYRVISEQEKYTVDQAIEKFVRDNL